MQRFLSWLNTFLAELQRRRVYRLLAVYCIAAFVVLQLADIAFEPLGISNTWFVVLLAVVVAGLPLAALLGWVFDLTESGVRRTHQSPGATAGRPGVGGLVTALALGVAMGGGAWWLWSRHGPDHTLEASVAESRIPRLDPRRIAVLYFDDHSPDGSLGYLAAGLSEALAHELSTVEGLEVVPRSGVKPFRDRTPSLDSIASALGVGSVVEGSVTGWRDQVRATIRLLDAPSNRLLDSRLVEGSLEHLFEFHDSVGASVSRALRKRLGREIRLRGAREGATSPDAWTAYRRALELMATEERFVGQEAGNPRAILVRADSLLERALELDPAWIQPKIARVDVACRLARMLAPHPGALHARWARRALDRIEATLAAHPESAEALALRGWVHLRLAYSPDSDITPAEHLDAAERDLRTAIQLSPDLPDAYWTLSEVLVNKRRFAEAVEAAEQARAADAFLEVEDEVLHNEFFAMLQLGPRDDAIRRCDEGHRRFPDNPNFIRCKLLILGTFPQVEPDVDRAWALLDTLVAAATEQEREPFLMFGTAHVAQVLARAGMADSARAVLRLARADSTPPMLASHEAKVHLLIGDPERAVVLLERWLTFDPDTAYLAMDWWFEGLRDYPPFRELVGLDRTDRSHP